MRWYFRFLMVGMCVAVFAVLGCKSTGHLTVGSPVVLATVDYNVDAFVTETDTLKITETTVVIPLVGLALDGLTALNLFDEGNGPADP